MFDKIKSVSVKELDKIKDDINLIDIRTSNEYNEKNISYATHIPMEELLNNTEEYLDENKTYHIICEHGVRSLSTVKRLVARGYDAINVLEGMSEYKKTL